MYRHYRTLATSSCQRRTAALAVAIERQSDLFQLCGQRHGERAPQIAIEAPTLPLVRADTADTAITKPQWRVVEKVGVVAVLALAAGVAFEHHGLHVVAALVAGRRRRPQSSARGRRSACSPSCR